MDQQKSSMRLLVTLPVRPNTMRVRVIQLIDIVLVVTDRFVRDLRFYPHEVGLL